MSDTSQDDHELLSQSSGESETPMKERLLVPSEKALEEATWLFSHKKALFIPIQGSELCLKADNLKQYWLCIKNNHCPHLDINKFCNLNQVGSLIILISVLR